jgi:hypothetical protein
MSPMALINRMAFPVPVSDRRSRRHRTPLPPRHRSPGTFLTGTVTALDPKAGKLVVKAEEKEVRLSADSRSARAALSKLALGDAGRRLTPTEEHLRRVRLRAPKHLLSTIGRPSSPPCDDCDPGAKQQQCRRFRNRRYIASAVADAGRGNQRASEISFRSLSRILMMGGPASVMVPKVDVEFSAA